MIDTPRIEQRPPRSYVGIRRTVGPDGSPVMVGVLPPGEYAVVTHVGPYEGVADAHGALDEWVTAQGRVQHDAAGARIEIYVTDPRAESDPTKFRVDVEQLLTDRHRPRR